MNRRVVITGLGIVAPNAIGLTDFEEAIRNGKSGIKHLPKLEELKFGCQLAGLPDLGKVNLKNYFSDLDLKFLRSDAIAYSVVAGKDAWKDAGLDIPDKETILWDDGIVFGCGGLNADLASAEVMDEIRNGQTRRLGTRLIEQRMNNGAAAYLGGMIGFGNYVGSNSSACCTGIEATIIGYERIKEGKSERMLCGSTEAHGQYIWAPFDSMRVLCRNSNDEPDKASRPMSQHAAGFVPSTGAGALVLESLESAEARGAKIYAEIIGSGMNSGGQRAGGSMTAPNSEGVVRCVQAAIKDSGISADDIDGISGHLTSTMADPLEIKNWAKALRRSGKDFPLINSLKSMIGHGLGAAGSMELVAVVLQLYKDFFHKTINCDEPHEEILKHIDASCIPNTSTINKEMSVIAKSGFAFGDVNTTIILKKWKG